MKPPAPEWAPWTYRAAMAVISTYAMGLLGWVTWRLMHAEYWPPSLLAQVLLIVGWIVLGLLAILIVQQVGLVSRNLIRNWNFKAGRNGLEANINAHQDEPKGKADDAA